MKTQQKSGRKPKRETILEAAIAAFRDEGYECASMDHIAELAGASKRTVYNHFGNKEALFQAVVTRLFDEAAALEQLPWDPNRPLEEQLVDFARAKALLAQDEACLIRVVLGVFVQQPTLVREVMSRAFEQRSGLVTWLREAAEAGRLEVPDPELAAQMFWAMVRGALFWPQLLQGPMDPATRDRLTREVVETFLSRYRPSSG